MAHRLLHVSFILCILFIVSIHGAVLRRTWTTQPWCESVRKPQWPFAYQKTATQTLEWQGRVNSNDQDIRHQCSVFGVQSKCHICQDFPCNGNSGDHCAFQLQGIPWSALPKNIPTVTDVPWAVGGQHRYDYDGATHLCVFLSGGHCLSPFTTDFSQCDVRCWGSESGEITFKGAHPNRNLSDAETSDIWSYSPLFGDLGCAQGHVITVAGDGSAGFQDGLAATSQFNHPRGVAVDSNGVVYVADTANHRIRIIDPTTKRVSTLAGDGVEGFVDGPALTAARFSYPSDVAVRESNSGTITVFVADTGNHRIRQIRNGVVTCLSGLCGAGVETVRLSQQPEKPHAGLADGDPLGARFDSPMGVAVDADGVVFVADTGNHLIRRIDLDGTTHTVAGGVVPSEDADTPGCLSPCLRGERGFRDGNLTFARFESPRAIAIGAQRTLIVSERHRIRRVTYDGGSASTIGTVTAANRVVTLAGSNVPGHIDGEGNEATFNAPAGVAFAADGRVYAASSTDCSVRQLTPASLVSRTVTCSTRATEVLRPSGCASYEQPVDELFLQTSPTANNIYYNYLQRKEFDSVQGSAISGRTLKDCTGSPPDDGLVQGDLALPLRHPDTQAVISDVLQDVEYGTTIKISCPAACDAASTTSKVYGSGLYSDVSSICLAAIHSGVIVAAQGGLVTVTLEQGTQSSTQTSKTLGSTAHGVTSLDLPSTPNDRARLFSIRPYLRPKLEVQSIAGAPNAPLGSLQDGCGYLDAQPPLAAKFLGIAGLDIAKSRSLSRTDLLYIADAGNNRIRAVSATCAKVCENGGVCSAPDACTCLSGWTGDDCTTPVCSTSCGSRQVCVGPDNCDCIPGYGGFPACHTPKCAQICAHGGSCSAPDTCSCASGWFDANCTTPVCTQTCGNGGNCTSPDTCTCSDAWKGIDCRVPVCTQTCKNRGSCVAPDSCLCAAGWSGYDCSLPICPQGDFVPHPSGYTNALSRPLSVESYVPCDFAQWCRETGEFDCLHRLYSTSSPVVNVSSGLASKGKTPPSFKDCLLIELSDDALTHFQYLSELNETSDFYRFAPVQPYGWDTAAPWRGISKPEEGFSPPFLLTSDRQVALVERRSIVQGVYVCAHGGSCVAPDVCECVSGWAGFDCRTPVCSQGYFSPSQVTYLAAEPSTATHLRQPVTNPTYTATVEQIGYTQVTVATEIRGGVRYKPAQGGYACSIRSITKWEKPVTADGSPAYFFNHPNYYSRYMDRKLSADGHNHTHWTDMMWPPLYNLSEPLLDDTREGWKRGGTWSYILGRKWQKGVCLVEFKRVCTSGVQAEDLVTDAIGELVVDTDASYRPQVTYTAQAAGRRGFWNSSVFGDCVDQVVRGCFNNGTCVAPGVCDCAPGWSGKDCVVPLCTQTCMNGGNCTLPDTCTCALGWTGADCSIALCAQECRNNGTCVAPDQCKCVTWDSNWRDGRENGGKPVFQLPDGRAQRTGYTGYDCNTPICVQAKQFVLNVASRSSSNFRALRGNYDSATATRNCDTYRCPQYDVELVANDGRSFQTGCSVGDPEPNPTRNSTLTSAQQIQNLLDDRDDLNIARVSDGFLCGNIIWKQGDIESGNGTNRVLRTNYVNVTKVDDVTWTYGISTPGEGVYECFNSGACVAPDECACGDGWTGIDCNTPLCRFQKADKRAGVSSGCRNGGVCVSKDQCRCITVQSSLHDQYSSAPTGRTGYFGSDCALPICIQGVFDPICNASVVANALNLTSGNITGIDGIASSIVSSGDGCFRCKNGGLCLAPDICACAEGWTGFDCSTPICELSKAVVASVRSTLFTVDELKVETFRTDPCGTTGGRWGKETVNGAVVGQGNCTLPMKCTCLCRQRYDKKLCDSIGDFCEKPWQDPFHRSIPPGFVYGTRDCVDGFQGIEDDDGNFQSCHLQIYVPTTWRRYTVSFVAIISVLGMIVLVAWYYIRKRVRRALLLAKAERRRSRKNSEENINKPKLGAFAHPKNE
ncbi:LCCL domain-containing protein [Phytophthora infestans]|uniref:LCCL domain-containing protein n=1 Tax=Phytophthora infestans TaxID=4787 RepID=A0A833WPQ9_PHYIN|nr:LCCL domain-containing protein [Phytophthora infestans]